MSERPRLLVDCDPGHDDALALAVAARHADVVGITTVAGNAPLEHTTRNALVLRDLLELDAPVHAGADRPLVAPPRHAPQVHGPSGLDGPAPRQPTRDADGDDAAAFIVDTCRAEEGIWLVAIGPLTNVALALRRAPDLAGRLGGISLMGGSATAGNVTPTAEFNVWADPEAAAAVFASGVRPLVMSGLNLTRQFALDDDFVGGLRQAADERATFYAELLDYYLDRQEITSGRRAAVAHDVCAVLAVTHPELIAAEMRPVQVETAGALTRGMTVVDERRYPGREDRANTAVGYAIDAERATALVRGAIVAAALPAPSGAA
ncbi:MAG: nucleoside hydrolase [Acidimicrobiia bacterium]|nr:nucleoside hydrolase [Acidimicrobiia bacterium]